MGTGIYVETRVAASMDRLWHATQDPGAHASWDLRFSSITHLPTPPGEPQRFRYDNRTVPFAPMTGVGISRGERHRPDGSCTSALRFAAGSRLSPIASGDGYWRYVPDGDHVRFLTGYDYVPGWQGRALDRAVVRPLIGWMTAWSFDRLRLWLDHGVAPTVALRRTVVVWTVRVALAVGAVVLLPPVTAAAVVLLALAVPSPVDIPRARRCLRRPRTGRRPSAPRVAAEVDAQALQRVLREDLGAGGRPLPPGPSPRPAPAPGSHPAETVEDPRS
jgi:hypothetical protein